MANTPQSLIPDCTCTFFIDIFNSSPPNIFLIKVQVIPSTSGNKESYTFTEFSLQPILETAIQWCLLKQWIIWIEPPWKLLHFSCRSVEIKPQVTGNCSLISFWANYMCLSDSSSPHCRIILSAVCNHIEPIPLSLLNLKIEGIWQETIPLLLLVPGLRSTKPLQDGIKASNETVTWSPSF